MVLVRHSKRKNTLDHLRDSWGILNQFASSAPWGASLLLVADPLKALEQDGPRLPDLLFDTAHLCRGTAVRILTSKASPAFVLSAFGHCLGQNFSQLLRGCDSPNVSVSPFASASFRARQGPNPLHCNVPERQRLKDGNANKIAFSSVSILIHFAGAAWCCEAT